MRKVQHYCNGLQSAGLAGCEDAFPNEVQLRFRHDSRLIKSSDHPGHRSETQKDNGASFAPPLAATGNRDHSEEFVAGEDQIKYRCVRFCLNGGRYKTVEWLGQRCSWENLQFLIF